MSDWLATIDDAQAREVMGALVRVSTYCAEHDLLSAGAAIRQVSLATKHGVEYLDGGWQTLVSGLKHSAIAAGAELRSSATVEQLRRVGGRYSVTCDGETLDADAVVLAVGPQACAALAPWSLELASATRALVPIRAACLDVVLSRLPDPSTLFTLGLDRPSYFSVHGAFAELGPSDACAVHVAKYLREDSALRGARRAAELEWIAIDRRVRRQRQAQHRKALGDDPPTRCGRPDLRDERHPRPSEAREAARPRLMAV